MRPATHTLTATAVAVILAACTSPTGGPGPNDPVSVSVDPGTALLASLGDTIELTATVRNSASQPLPTAVTWSAAPRGVVDVGPEGRVVALDNGVATVTATAGDVSGTATVTVEQKADSVAARGDNQSMDVTQPLDSLVTVTLLDARGNPIAGAPVSFSVVSGGGSVEPPASTTDADGSVSASWRLGTVAGIQELEAEAGFSGEGAYRFTANAFPLAATALVVYSGDGQIELISTELHEALQVQLVDSLGNGVPDTPVVFTVNGDAALESVEVTTDLDGIASVGLTLGSQLGPYLVTATVPDSLTATGQPLDGTPVSLTAEAVPYAVDPVGELTVGDTVTLTGSGFHPDLTSNSILVDGMAATLVSGSQTELTMEVPGFGCTPQRVRAVEVSRTGRQSTQAATVTPAGALSLGVGGRAVLSDPDDFCLQLLAGTDEEYLVGITSTSWFDGGSTFAITGLDSVGPAPAPPYAPVNTSPRTGSPDLLLDRATSALPTGELRLRRMEEDLIASSSVGWVGSSPSVDSSSSFASEPTVGSEPSPVSATVGDQLELRLPDVSLDPCLSYLPVTAEVFSVGARVVLATSEPLPGALTPERAVLEAAATTFQSGFGDVGIDRVTDLLGLPDGWDADSRVVVVFTPYAASTGLPVFASVVDQLPRSDCPASDEGHYVYVDIPANASASQLSTVLADAPPELAHHFGHMVQWVRRLADGDDLLPSWLAEGQAELVVEYVGMALNGLEPHRDLGSTVLSSPGLDAWIPERFDRLALFNGWDGASGTVAGAPEQCSLFGFIGTPCAGEAAPGAAWSFLRYLSDRFGAPMSGGQDALHRAIIDLEPSGDLVAQLEVALGTTLPELIVDWAGTLYVDGRLTPADAPELQLSSWILTEMIPTGPKRLTPESFAFGDFERTGSVVGGGTAYTLISAAGDHGPLSVLVRDGAGGPIADALGPRVWVVRMR